jgi:hypothetical protein
MDLPQKRPFKRPRDVFTYTSFPYGCDSIMTAGYNNNNYINYLIWCAAATADASGLSGPIWRPMERLAGTRPWRFPSIVWTDNSPGCRTIGCRSCEMNELCAIEEGIFPTVGKMDRPDPSWTTDELGVFAKHHDDACAGLGRQMAIHRYRQGHALTLARKKVPHGGWGIFLEEHGISSSSDGRARNLYKEVKSEKELEGMTIADAYQRYRIEKPAKPKGNPYANLLASLPAISCDLGEENYPDDTFELNTLCTQASAEAKEIRERLKSSTATDEDRARHSVATRRWLTLMNKRDQALAREARRERAQAAQQKLLDESEATESGVVKLYGLLKETCDVMQQLSSAACTVNAAIVAERQEFGPLMEKYAELAEDLSMWLG